MNYIHCRDEHSSTTLQWMLGFCILHMIGDNLYSKVYLYSNVIDYIWI